MVKVIYESFCKAMIRFWDNRFIKDNDVEYYRMQIEQLRHENKELQDKLLNVLMPKTVVELPDEVGDWKQINKSQFVPPAVKRAQLERESYLRARSNALAEMASSTGRTIEELEKEVGIS